MKSKVIIILISVVLILSSTGYTLDNIVDTNLYNRVGNIENKLNYVDIKVDRNSDIMKLGFDRNVSDHNSITGRLDGFYSRVNSIDISTKDVLSKIDLINNKLSSNLLGYTNATNKIDSNNKSNNVMLRGDTLTVPAKTDYLSYILVGLISGLFSAGLILITDRISRHKSNKGKD